MTDMRNLAIAGWGFAIACAIGAVVVRIVAPAPFLPVTFGFGPVAMMAFIAMATSWATIGAFIAIRRPENLVGPVMVASGAGYALSMLALAVSFAFAADGTIQGRSIAEVAGWITVLGTQVGAFAFLIGFIFPTGRAQSPTWARLLRLSVPGMLLFSAAILLQPGALHLFPTLQNPFGIGPDFRAGQPVSPLIGVFAVTLSPSVALSIGTRYRAAGQTERQQLKWFSVALIAAFLGVGFSAWGAVLANGSPGEIGLIVYGVSLAGVPVAIAIAILRHHLYDIDRLISRTVGYAVVTAALAGVFSATALTLGSVLGSQGAGESFQVAGATLLVVALFGPVRRRAQAIVDRRFDRSHYDASRTISALTQRLRDDVDLGRLESDVLNVVSDTFHPSDASVWIRSRPSARRALPAAAGRHFPTTAPR
jgi:hypothetical protein